TLYRALDGAGAGDGVRTVEELRAAALAAYEHLDLPSWRRSGFWTTSLRDLDVESLQPHHVEADGQVPAVVAEALKGDEPAGLLVQRDATVVHVWLDPELAERGVVLCSLEDAVRDHPALVAEYFMRRLTYDRHKLEAAAGADMRHRGIYFTEAEEHLDLFTVDLHEVGPTTGDTVWKGAATGHSRASYEGLIKIRAGAQESHTYLQTHSMMLSPRAKVDAIP